MPSVARIVTVAALLVCSVMQAQAALVVRNLQVEYRSQPLGIDVQQPRFSWQMEATAGERGVAQAAYQIEVRHPKGALAWDSKKVDSPEALHIRYAGSTLEAATRYGWTVTVWTKAGARLTANSWFETGLMDPSPSLAAWGGAKWIGGGNDDLVLYSPYLAIFDVKYVLTIAPGSTRASFVYGANDSRLMDRNKNIYQVQSARDQSYIKLELDISALGGSPDAVASIHVYRAGYKDTDNPSQPIKTFPIDNAVINNTNKNAEHAIEFRSVFGQITVTIDGSTTFAVNLNPVGQGGDYLTFGMLCDMGFSVGPGQSATFRDVIVRNNRVPNAVLFREDLAAGPYNGIYADTIKANPGLSVSSGKYVLAGGGNGAFVVRNPSHNSMPMLRTTFKTGAKAIGGARLYVTARGIYEIFLNGRRVGDDYYNPGLTQYNITHMYQTYDVTSLLQPGDNAMGAMLGEGWWSGLLSFGSIWNHFGDRQSLLAKLVITYKDGTSETVTTNERTWKYYGRGPVVYSSLDFGEIYDAARENAVAGWATVRYKDSAWKPAVVVPVEGTTFSGTDGGGRGGRATPFTFDKLSLVGQVGNNAGVFRTLTAKSVKEVRPKVYVYDMGQNLVGVPKLAIANGRPGGTITLRYAEMPYPDLPASGRNVGMIMTENYRAALSQDVYTMKAGPQTFQPRFTSHGYQYIEITGIDQPLPLTAVQGITISSVRSLTADYKTSSEKVNRLWSNLVWSNVDNFLTIPTDCPQRNERMGWSGDINVFSRTATYVSNANQFLTRHMNAMRDVQTPAGRFTDVAPVGGGFGGVLWGSAGIVVPWETYLQYKDVGLLERHYPAMAAYMAYLETTIDPKTGLSSDGQLGDWLGPQNNALGSAFLVTAYHAFSLDIMAKVADLLGKPTDAAKYRDQYDKRKAYFNATFVNGDRKTLATGGGGMGGGPRGAAPGAAPEFRVADTQTSYAVPLAMGLFNSDVKPQMIKNLADAVARENKDDGGVMRPKYSLMTGFIGTAWISKALSQSGLSDLAYRLLHNNQYPSWLYTIDQGATSIWERLNGYTVENGFGGNNSMNSFNHYSFGAVGQWMLSHSLGIERDEPGFRTFILQPEPDPTGVMTSAEGFYDSMYGKISSAWKVEGATLAYRATVPANTTATLYLPTSSADSVREGGKDARGATGITFVKYESGKAVYTLKSGSYTFTALLGLPVKVTGGLVSGAAGRETSITVFKGVPFAAAPSGERRWKEPGPVVPWKGTLAAATFGPSCIQTIVQERKPWTYEFMAHNEISEDCLHLNVWTGAKSARERRPVFVYIYGGGFNEGSTAIPVYDGEGLAKKGVVVVTANYRVGILGFFVHPELTKESPNRASGNYGLLDQVAALRWVRDNIAAFGGDPNRVTIAGQSAGGMSVHSLIASPLAKGLFHRAIVQSGGSSVGGGAINLRSQTLADVEANGVKFAQAKGAASLAALRAMTWQKIVEPLPAPAAGAGGAPAAPALRFSTIVDGYMLPASVREVVAQGKHNDVPVLTGANLGELGGISGPQAAATLTSFTERARRTYGPMADEYLELYPAANDEQAAKAQAESSRDQSLVSMYLWARERAKTSKTPAYTYLWDHTLPGPDADRYGAFHTSEVPYVLNTLNMSDRPFTDRDRAIAEMMSSYWANFAAKGDPNGKGVPTWNPAGAEHVVMEVGDKTAAIALTSDPVRFAFFEKFLTQPPVR